MREIKGAVAFAWALAVLAIVFGIFIWWAFSTSHHKTQACEDAGGVRVRGGGNNSSVCIDRSVVIEPNGGSDG